MSKKHPITISSWTLGDKCTFEERVKAAKNAGFEGIGLRAETYVDALNEGLSDRDIINMLGQYDMRVTEVEYTAQKLKELCERAGDLTIGVEPMPYSGIPNVKKAWEIVAASGCENAGIILDSWHWLRAGQPVDLSVLDGIPADRIVSVQINDVYERAYADAVLRDESMHDRLAPGTGCGNTEAFCRMLKEKGVEPLAVGVEVISDKILSVGVEEAANYNFENTKKVLEHSWPELLSE